MKEYKEIAKYLTQMRTVTNALSTFGYADKDYVRKVKTSNKRFDKWIAFLNKEAKEVR